MRPGRNTQPTPDHEKAARDYLNGKTQKQALIEAGYSPKQARKGLVATLKASAPLRQAFRNQIDKWAALGELVPLPTARASIVRTRLLLNVMRGKDSGVQSAKLLGQDKELSMWEPDQAVGIVAIGMPPAEWRDRYLKPAEPDEKTDLKPS